MKRALLYFLIFLSLAGCSKLSLVYKYADGYLASQLDHYFDLTSDQKKKAKSLAQKELRRFVEEETPKVTVLMGDFVALVDKPTLSQKEYNDYSDRLTEYFLKLLPRFEPSLTEFALMLTLTQFEYYSKVIQKETQDKAEKLRTPEKQAKELKRRFERGFDFIGLDLNREQEGVMKEYLATASYPFELEREHQLKIARVFLDASKNPEKLKAMLHQFLSKPLEMRDPQLVSAYDRYRIGSRLLQWKIFSSLNEKQKARVRETLEGLSKQLVALRTKVISQH